jgi:hypothetical protein
MKIKYFIPAVCAVLIINGCGAAQKTGPADFYSLAAAGDCAGIKTRVNKDVLSDDERGALALCVLAEGNGADVSAQKAVKILSKGTKGPVFWTAGAEKMIKYARIFPGRDHQFNLQVIRTALGAAGSGPFKITISPEPGSEAGKALAAVVLGFLADILDSAAGSSPVSVLPQNQLVEIWNGTYSLLGGSVQTNSALFAWQLYMGLTRVALRMWNPLEHNDFSFLLINTAIEVVENNPQIAVAVKCDLSSPYEQLRSEVSAKVDLLGRLERAVSAATGCSRGRYAPHN